MPALELRTWAPLRECRRLPKSGGLYVLRCMVNGKLYVGKSMDLQRRAYKHCRPEHFNSLVARAVLAHGADAFEIQIWCLGDDEQALLAAEVELIASMGSMAPAGYNLTAGGEGSSGYRHSPEAREKIAAAGRGRKRDPAAVASTAEAHRGMKRSAEATANISASLKGRKRSAESIARQSATMAGRIPTTETRAKMIEAMKASDKVKANTQRLGLARQRRVLMWPAGSMVPIEFESVKAAAAFIGAQRSDVSNYCRGAEARSGNRFAYME